MKRLLVVATILSIFGGCTTYDRTAAQPQGGELPLDRAGGGIDVVSRTTGARDPRPMQPVAVGQIQPGGMR
jgi:hypothetical protein